VKSSIDIRGRLLFTKGEEARDRFTSISMELSVMLESFSVSSRHSQWLASEHLPHPAVVIAMALSTQAHELVEVQLPHPIVSIFDARAVP
jgi:hypothetical protein